MRVLCLSGGGFKGAFQVPVVEYLMARNEYDLILGVSVGAINGVCAAQGDLEVMREFWEDIDCSNPVFGVRGYLSLAVYKNNGWFSLKPVKKKLEKYVSLDKLKIPFGAGVVIRETREYMNLMSADMKSDTRLTKAILGSAAIASLMEPMYMRIGDDRDLRLVCDGGHRHVLPVPPDGADHVDAVFCSPIVPDQHTRKEVDNFLEAILWLIDVMMDNITLTDFDALQVLPAMGTSVDVYAPRSSYGSLLKCDRETLQMRMKEGQYATRHPLELRW